MISNNVSLHEQLKKIILCYLIFGLKIIDYNNTSILFRIYIIFYTFT